MSQSLRAPATSVPPPATTINDDNSRENFLAVGNIGKCKPCNATGSFVLNGQTYSDAQIVLCKDCQKDYSGNNLRALIDAANCKPGQKKPIRVPDFTAADYTKLKTENARPLKSNAKLQAQNDTLHSKTDSLTTKVEELFAYLSTVLPTTDEEISPTRTAQRLIEENDRAPTQNPTQDAQLQPQSHHLQDQKHCLPKPNSAQPQHAQPRQIRQTVLTVIWTDVFKNRIDSLPDTLHNRVEEASNYLQQDVFQAKRTAPRTQKSRYRFQSISAMSRADRS